MTVFECDKVELKSGTPRRTERLIQILFPPEAHERFGGVALRIRGTNGKQRLEIVREEAKVVHSA